MKYIYTFIIILICILSLYIISRQLSPNKDIFIKGRPYIDDDISTNIDRIDWSNKYPGRVNMIGRYGLYAIVISFFTGIIYTNNIDSFTMLQSVIVVWLVLITSHSFFTHHADKFCNYFIDSNIKHIRKKLNIGSDINNLSYDNTKLKRTDKCFSYIS